MVFMLSSVSIAIFNGSTFLSSSQTLQLMRGRIPNVVLMKVTFMEGSTPLLNLPRFANNRFCPNSFSSKSIHNTTHNPM